MVSEYTDLRAIYEAKPRSYKIAKRAGDIIFSAIGLVVLSPVFLITAAAILREDGRPIIYAAPRNGKDGKPFFMYKFRSMKQDSDTYTSDLLMHNEQTGPAFKMKNDPRVTRVGQVIRKYFIDELPQLVNVIKGEMSIVGPRAIQQTETYTLHEAQRMIVQPGLTCYWQTKGRTRLTWEEWLELDLAYIKDMSLTTDILLILRTMPVIIHGEGS